MIGTRIEVELLLRTADRDVSAIDGCLTAGAVVSDGNGFRFRNEIARRAVEQALPAHRRVALNRRVLDLLVRGRDEGTARLAHHADAAGDAAAVLRFAPVAARQAASLGAHREAAKQYERALRYARDADTRASLLSAVGIEYALTHASAAPRQSWRALGVPYEEGLALLDSGEPDAMALAVRIFERLGARATVARARATMRQRGVTAIPRGPRADTRANRFGLTRREQQVLRWSARA